MRIAARRIESIVPRKAEGFGGKAKNLAALARAGFPVPAAFALGTEACDRFYEAALPEGQRPGALLGAPTAEVSEARLLEVRAQAEAASVPEEAQAALRHAFRRLRDEGASAVAVRSSSTREDQDAASAAGLHESVLGVRDEEALLRAAKTCWLSLLHPRVVAYQRAHGGEAPASVGLVVQAMVPADAAGVMFTVNPLSGDPGEMVINASFGLGSAVVDGKITPDTYRIDKASGWVRDRVIGEKRSRATYSAEGGLVEEALGPEEAAREALDESALSALIELGLRVEDHFGDARDVEWAVVDGQLFVLQARPVTALPFPLKLGKRARRRSRRKERTRFVWSNVNVGEALPGVATPLTWSILSDFSERGFHRAFGALGCAVPKDAELVASFRGRIYLNLSEFLAIASQLPGLDPKVLLAFGGGGGLEELSIEYQQLSSRGFFLRLPLTVSRYLRENYRLTERVEQFEERFTEEHDRIVHLDLRLLSGSGLDRVLHRVEALLDRAGLTMLNVYGNLLATVLLLRGLLDVFAKDRAEALQRDLLTGLAEVDSAVPGITLVHIAQMARREPEARALLLETPLEALRVEDLPEGPTKRALVRFFEAHGFRGAREAEIAEPRWSEDPSLPFATLRGHLGRALEGRELEPLAMEQRLRERRERAAEDLEAALPLPLKVASRHLLSLVQRFLRLRERLRAKVVRVLSLYRSVALDASRRIEAMEPGVGPDAAFFLSLDELHALLRGSTTSISLLLRRRRLQFERDRALPAPPDSFVGFPPPPALEEEASDLIEGLAASAGVVRGRARVLSRSQEADALEAGEVLVAPYADVGWSPLFLVASAVVTDLGGTLSHASVVLREYGVPAVVNVKVGTRRIRTGDLIEVDGDVGLVRILERAPDADLSPG